MSVGWLGFAAYRAFVVAQRPDLPGQIFDLVVMAFVSLAAVLSLIRRERIEIHSDQIIWRKTYFGITHSDAAPLDNVLGAEWSEGEQQGHQRKSPSYVEFYLADRSVKACIGLTFDEFDHMRGDIQAMYPEVIKRWGRSSVHSKDFTLLNLS